MPQLDLMPGVCREAIIRRSWTRRWIGAYLAVGMVLVGAGWAISSRNEDRQRELARISMQVDENLRRNKERTRLLQEIEQTQTMIDRYNRVAWPVRVSEVVSSIAQSMPETLTLSSFALTPRRDNPGRDKKSAERVYLVVEMEGIAPDDLELARFVSGMESHGLFQRVTLDFARSTEVRGVSARAFRMSAEIDLQKTYRFADAAQGGQP